MRKRLKETLVRTLPVILVITVTLILTRLAYHQMIEAEKRSCWSILEESTRRVAEDIQVRFTDNATMLSLAADAIAMKTDASAPEVIAYLETVQKRTMFNRIDLLCPDDTIISAKGERMNMKAYGSFAWLSRRGPHFTQRGTDGITGEEAFYCVTPIRREGEIVGLLVGMVDCGTLHEQFPTSIYDETAQMFLIDRVDGSYLMDNWHDEMLNLREIGPREMLPEYEDIDFVAEMLTGNTNAVAFYSRTNGRISYQYYMPVASFGWTLALVVQDEEVFAGVESLKADLNKIGLCVVLLLMLYLGWNVTITAAAVRNQDKIQQLEQERVANEAKTRFLTNMSHDIRTPLNGIIGMVDVIKHQGGDAEQTEKNLHKIEASARYLLTLANDVLDLSAMEHRGIDLAAEPIDIHLFIGDLMDIMQPRAEAADIVCHTIFGQIDHPRVLASSVHVERILLNLISNAIRYNREKGEVWVTIDEKACEGDRVTYRFEVRDTGVGMTEEFQKTMFDSFEQENAGARTSYRGYGLGLSIVKKLVSAMNGEITVHSRKDEGSTFTVLLTFQVDHERRAAREMLSEVFHPAQDIHGMRVLVAEDNELNMEIADVLLTEAGAIVTRAADGQQAVNAFLESAPGAFEAILMDIMMPNLDGYGAAKAIRAMNRADAKSVPIIAMTAITFAEDVQRCLDAGMNEHLAKPLDMNALIARLAQYRRGMRKGDSA